MIIGYEQNAHRINRFCGTPNKRTSFLTKTRIVNDNIGPAVRTAGPVSWHQNH